MDTSHTATQGPRFGDIAMEEALPEHSTFHLQVSKKAKAGSGISRSKKAAAEAARLAAMDPERRREEEIKKALRESERATQLQKRLENTMRKVLPCSFYRCSQTGPGLKNDWACHI